MVNIWLDDERPAPIDWLVAKTAQEAISLLLEFSGHVNIVSLDHDLGDGNGTGYDVACWLEERHHFGHPLPNAIRVHSANPAGRQNIRLALSKIPGFKP